MYFLGAREQSHQVVFSMSDQLFPLLQASILAPHSIINLTLLTTSSLVQARFSSSSVLCNCCLLLELVVAGNERT